MENGIVPSKAFNEQLKRTVRETVRRERNKRQTQNRWHKKGGGSSGANIVDFSIDDVFCPDDAYNSEGVLYVQGTVTFWSGGCSAGYPGQNSDGTIDVYDKCNIMSVLTEDELLAATGRAVYMYPQNLYACLPKWYVLDICYTQECV